MRHSVRWLLGIGAAVAVGASAPVVAEHGLQPVLGRDRIGLVHPRPEGRARLKARPEGRTDTAPQHPRVRPGIDVLLTDSAHLVAGKRVGLITNQTGVDAAGVRTIDRLAGVAGVTLAAIFAPEHGIRGNLAPGEAVADTVDLRTGVPIYSLYGANRAPTRNQLARLDVLIVDLQDVGARTFTYVSTTLVAMRAAQAAGVRIVVLDRPNPIGCLMQGPVLDTVYASFSLGMLPVPLRHGLTIGELARFANTELGIGADLVVVPVQGWRRCDWADRTGLPWVRPSPNLPDLAALAWYPGTVLFEATNLSIGRGTDAPFQQLGAPWLRTRPLRQMLHSAGLEAQEVRFTPAAPGDGRFDGVAVAGIRLPPLRPSDGDPVAVAVWLLDALAAQQPDSFRLDTLGLFRRLGVRIDPGHTGVCNAIDCDDWRSFRWEDQVNRFRRRARPYLLYQR